MKKSKVKGTVKTSLVPIGARFDFSAESVAKSVDFAAKSV